MDDVEAKFEFAAERKEEADCGEFGFFGTRLEIGLIDGPIGIDKIFCGGIDGCGSSAWTRSGSLVRAT